MVTLYHRQWSRQELLQYVGRMDQLAGIRLVEAADGLERGTRVLQVWTGSGLSFDVVADRALDIAACRYKGISLAWASSVGGVHPAYYEPEDMRWLRSFGGGLLVTCGLDQFGSPCSDDGEELGLHGRLSNLPAQAVGYHTSWVGSGDSSRYELEITGQVRQTRVFGENLVLRRRILTHLGSNAIRIEDEVTNEGFEAHPHMVLYHFNLGFPLVSAESTLRLETEETIARDADAEPGLSQWSILQSPTAGYREQVFRHVPVINDKGQAQVEVENPTLGVGLRLNYERASLPYLVQWKMMGQGTYVLGTEPANCGVIQGRATARAKGQLPHLAPGESRSYVLDVEVIER